MEAVLEDKYKTKEVLKRLLKNHVSPYKNKIYLAMFFMFIVALCAAGIVKFVEPAIDKIFLEKDRTMLYILPIGMVILSATKGIAEYFQNYLIKSVGQRILSDLQIELYAHLLKSDIDFIHSQSSARLISRFTNDISLMRGAVSNLLVGLARHFLTVLFLIILMFNLEPVLSTIIFVIFPLAIYPILKNGRKIRNLAFSAQEELGNYTAKLDETFESIKIVKSFQAEKFESGRARKYIEHIYDLYRSSAKYDALTSPIMETLSGLAIAAILIYGGYMVSDGKTTPGALLAFISAFVSAYRPYKSLIAFNVNFQEGIASATRLFKVLDHKPQIEDSVDGIDIKIQKADIKFKDVYFSYGNKQVLKCLNLEIANNSTIAIVGMSGEGKTSIANLLLRFYERHSGEITINGYDISKIKLENLRSQISLVTQDTHLFDATVEENIKYNITSATEKDVIYSAKAASAHDFIMTLPEGYKTIIGPKGKSLSGGQRQRLALARAFLRDSPILILDEATSSLDPHTEQEIKSSIQLLCKNRTTIIITHRLNTIENVDNIFVVKNGCIVESGIHKDLIEKKGEYFTLYQKMNEAAYK
jgi:subfamily B ATP-binding cassette protein MsbA